MMITIVSTSSCGRKKKVYLLENIWRGRKFEIGQRVETTCLAPWPIGNGHQGKLIGFNRPNGKNITSAVLKVLLAGEKEPRNLKMEAVRIIKGS